MIAPSGHHDPLVAYLCDYAAGQQGNPLSVLHWPDRLRPAFSAGWQAAVRARMEVR
jgi:hypothetical protein